jgi:Zn-dependent protease
MRFLEIFKRRVLLMHVSGIPVRADYRWFFVFLLMSVITANSVAAPGEFFPLGLLFGFLTTLVLFACVFLHELSHAFIARIEGVRVVEIILHPFGGMARLLHEPKTPRAEFRIAIAGPVASFLLAVLFALLIGVARAAGVPVFASIFFILFLFNFPLAIFNMFPGYPLDGGRVLRAYLWKSGKDLNEATILTGRCGQVIAALLVVAGLLIALVKADFFTGFWTVLVGLFLYDAAAGIVKEVRSTDDVRVEDVMHLPVVVAPETNILHFVDNILTVHRRTVFPVARDKQFFGMLLLHDLKSVPREKWHETQVVSVMRPIASDHFVECRSTLEDARDQMRTNGVGAVGVVDDEGRLVGFLGGTGIKKGRNG